MSKQIKIPDHLHQRIKGAADAHYRSMAGEIEWMMDFIGGINGARDNDPRMWSPGKQQNDAKNTPTPKNTDLSNLPDSMQEFITCPNCGMASYNAMDIREKYCGNCHKFHSDMANQKKSEATPLPTNSVSDLFATPVKSDGELACCVNELQPCKHWVWDSSTGEGYRNSLSGRFMEVE